jgi:hypothetical protein
LIFLFFSICSNSISYVDPNVHGPEGDRGVFPPRIVLADNQLEVLAREPWEEILQSLLDGDETTYIELNG